MPQFLKIPVVLMMLLAAGAARADLEFVVRGIEDPLRSNVLSHIDVIQLGRGARASNRDLEKLLDKALAESRVALRPYGYYQPEITGRFYRTDERNPVLELTIRPGAPIRIDRVEVAVEGAGANRRALTQWRDDWPLKVGSRLDQVLWKQHKQLGLETAQAAGYLNASYTTHRLELDLDDNTAAVLLVLDTDKRFVVGDVDFGEHALRPNVVESIPRFETGDPYTASLRDNFRVDLWRTGYFTDVEVIEKVHADRDPPTVDLEVRLESDTRNRYLGAIGYGTDTGIRLQANWTRQPMSRRGDRLEVGVGWQEFDEEFALRGNYRLPRQNRKREFWMADMTVRFENQDLEFKRSDQDESFIKLANGNIDERHFRFGPLKIMNRDAGDQQISVTTFVQYLNSDRKFDPVEPLPVVTDSAQSRTFERLLRGIDNAVSAGVDLDIIAVSGSSFETSGHRERAWLFTSSEAFGSDVDFTQAYFSTRRSYLVGERWKFLLRAEVGYTDAAVDEVSVDVGGTPLDLSITQLPNFYRFRAGGSASVRGYAFEQLSNNNVGSNHIATASGEVEFRFAEKWSAAVFADIGNAFNDFSDANLKLGIGVGIRWYSIAGPIRIDIAQARDFDDRPLRLHFTIGTPLL